MDNLNESKKISYQDNWDDILNGMQEGYAEKRTNAKAALDVKSATESIEQQKRMVDLQDNLIQQQNEMSTQTRKLGRATIFLTIFTGLLFFATVFYAFITFYILKGSNEQLIVLKSQTQAIAELKSSIDSVKGVVSNNLIKSIDLQTETFNLEKRPYLYVYFEPIFKYQFGTNTIFGGGYIHYKNEGQITATVIKTDLLITADTGDVKIEEWYSRALGGMPGIKTLFPQHVDAKIRRIGGLNAIPKFFFIGVLVRYTGIDKGKTYWYKFSQVYNIYGDGKDVTLSLITNDTSWDEESGKEPSLISRPDFSIYKDFLGKIKGVPRNTGRPK